MQNVVKRYVPSLDWLPNYRRENLRGDLIAGITTAVMLVPQGMAYAMLAGLPPIIGLYASMLPLAVYALLGTSRQLAVGPVAMVSLLVASGVSPLANGDAAAYLGLAVLLSAMVGVMQLVMGLGRLGFLTNFLSHPVISGFTSAAALIIGFSQLEHLLGVDIPRSHHIHTIILSAVERIGEVDPTTVAIGLVSVAVLLTLKKRAPRFPAALAVVSVSTLAVWAFDLSSEGVKIVADIPAGFPAPALPAFSLDALQGLLPTALTIAFVSFMESISVAKAFANRKRYDIDPNQELVALGAANIVGSFFKAYPVTGGFSRTAVNAQAGANTPLASLITAGVIGLTLAFLTPLFHYLPKAVLAAIIMVAVSGLVDTHEIRHLYQVKRADLVLLTLTFFATLSVGIEQGILLGVGASMVWFVFRATKPHTAVLGRLPGTDAYRNVRNFPEVETWDELLILRIDAEFYYGNVTFLKDTIKGHLASRGPALKAVIIDASSVNDLDSSADSALHDIAGELKDKDIELFLASVKGPVRQVMRRSHFIERLGQDRFTFTIEAAVARALRRCECAYEPPLPLPQRPSPEGPNGDDSERVGAA